MEQILQENRVLKDAFNAAALRIAALEEGQHHFFDEGIYDLVNAAHASTIQAPPIVANIECMQMDNVMMDSGAQPEIFTGVLQSLADDSRNSNSTPSV